MTYYIYKYPKSTAGSSADGCCYPYLWWRPAQPMWVIPYETPPKRVIEKFDEEGRLVERITEG